EVAGIFPRLVAPRVGARLAGLRHDVERPQQLAGAHAEAADIVAGALFLRAAVAGAVGVAGDDDHVAEDDRAGGVGELSRQRLRIGEMQRDAAAGAEVGRRLAGLGVERVEKLAADRDEAAIRAALPEVEAARRLAGRFLLRRLLLPQRLAGRAIERGDEAVRVLRVDDAVDDDRRRFQVRVDAQLGKRIGERRVHRRPAPGDLQALDVVARDLVERRVAGERVIGAVVAPLARRALLRANHDSAAHDHGDQSDTKNAVQTNHALLPRIGLRCTRSAALQGCRRRWWAGLKACATGAARTLERRRVACARSDYRRRPA